MRAMSVIPGHPGPELIAERPDPPPAEGSVLVAALVAVLGATYHHGPASRPYHRPVDMNRIGASMVLPNSVIFGTVSAARRHYELAVQALAGADQAWLGRLISSASRYPAGRRGLPSSQVSKGRVDLTR